MQPENAAVEIRGFCGRLSLPQGETAVLPNVNYDGPVRDPAGLAAVIEDFVAKH